MLNKFLNARKLAPFASHGRPRPGSIQQGARESHGTSSALKIVHPGGVVESYYMAIPAVNIMKKYPSFVLARPEVFRRPWDSLVRSHEILSPGEKFYRPSSHRTKATSEDQKARRRSFGITILHRCIDVKHKSGLAAIKTRKDEGIVAIADNSNKEFQQGEKRKPKNGVSWQPRLEAISERGDTTSNPNDRRQRHQRQRRTSLEPPETNPCNGASEKLITGDVQAKIKAARDIRKVVRKSSGKTRLKFAPAGVIPPLVSMPSCPNLDACQASLLALLNLAVRNGAVPPLVEILKLQNNGLKELVTAAILTLSAAAPNISAIASSGAAPFLFKSSAPEVFKEKSMPSLHYTTYRPAKRIRRASRDHRYGLILTLVETVEDGSLLSTQHAVGALLSLCESCREKYREHILKEGAIPGLLRLTVEGTNIAQERARTLLDLLRDTPQEKKLAPSVQGRIVIISPFM
ncbi:hyphally regulated cell wall protein 3-like isoform X1 [Hibiscus syriacus]|uniref:Hyphally regulated cell wall protein 3-like isoform X1 n=1 Tax=Hibiscus syriacus TaxID=106335 RepID=A0A6A2ZEN3_HIBSY|nr:hyphally regulated cell wall protein 3-like isoform X1 [Hibiscus syriacus]